MLYKGVDMVGNKWGKAAALQAWQCGSGWGEWWANQKFHWETLEMGDPWKGWDKLSIHFWLNIELYMHGGDLWEPDEKWKPRETWELAIVFNTFCKQHRNQLTEVEVLWEWSIWVPPLPHWLTIKLCTLKGDL